MSKYVISFFVKEGVQIENEKQEEYEKRIDFNQIRISNKFGWDLRL